MEEGVARQNWIVLIGSRQMTQKALLRMVLARRLWVVLFLKVAWKYQNWAAGAREQSALMCRFPFSL